MSKVAQLNPAKGGKGDRTDMALPRPLKRVRDKTVDILGRYLADTLDGADDKLFDMADGAGEDVRDRYFEAMRELRVKRAELETDFREKMIGYFAELARRASGDDQGDFARAQVDIDNLSLVDDEDVETDVAVDNMARRARSSCDEQMRAFNHRVEHIFESKFDADEKTSPLDPRQIAHSFQKALEKLELNMQARLIVFKLFERGVLSEVGFVVSEANQILMDAGVLPEMKTPPIKPARRPGEPMKQGSEPEQAAPSPDQPSQGSGGSGGGGNVDTAQMFGMLQELLGGLRQSGGGLGSVMPVGPAPANIAVMQNGVPYINGAPAPDASVVPVPSQDLMQLLSRIQHLEQSLQTREDGGLEEVDVKNELSGLLETEYGAESVHALDQEDDDVINLVAMLFDFILDDVSLPAEIKALVGRLQIPLLKVAIADKAFFARDDHPARQLLNLLARAGSQWSPEQGENDELYQQVENSVFRILNEFNTDTTLFRELLDGMQAFLNQEDGRRERVEERLREQEEGKAFAETCKHEVRTFLDKRLAGRRLPSIGVRILREAWQQVLYLTLLREGEDSKSWQQRSRLAEALVWSLLPHADQKSLQKLKDLSPRLLGGLKKGLESIQYDPVEIRHLLLELRKEHERLLRGMEVERIEVQPEEQDDHSANRLPEDHPRVRQAARLKPGQWIEIGLGDASRRCKLAANIRQGEKLVFINRRGIKVVEHSAQSLGVALDQGVARLIDEGALFDRALEAVIGGLRSQQQQQHPEQGKT